LIPRIPLLVFPETFDEKKEEKDPGNCKKGGYSAWKMDDE